MPPLAQESDGLSLPVVIALLVLGTIVLALLALRAIRAVRPRVTDIDDVEGSTGLVVIGAVSGRNLGRPVLSMNGHPLRPADGLQQICRMLEHNGLGTAIKVLTIVRPGLRGPGASFAIDLAHNLAAQGRTVLLVLGNLRQPGPRSSMGLSDSLGLAQLLEDDSINPITLLVSVSTHLLVLPAGKPTKDPAALLSRPRLGQLIGSLRDLGLTAIIDAPPAGFPQDVLPLAHEADATLLIVQSGSRWRDVEEAARMLRLGDVTDPAAVLVGTRW
jgi:hypothetical protein